MAASRLGSQLLDQVKEETLDEFLHDVRTLCLLKDESILGIPSLDNILNIIRSPPPRPNTQRWTSPTGQFPNLVNSDDPEHDEDEDIDHNIRHQTLLLQERNTYQKPPIIEITTPSSTSILNSPSLTTGLCIYLASLAVLNSHVSAVLYISLSSSSSSFLASKLYSQILSILSHHRQQETPTTNPHSVALQCLSRIQIHTPLSTPSFHSTLLTLLSMPPPNLPPSSTLHYIILDPLPPSFHHQDLLLESPALYPSLPTLLSQLQQGYSSTILYTSTSQLNYGLKPTLRLEMSSLVPMIPKFAPSMSITECLRDLSKRKEVVRKGRGIVRTIIPPGNMASASGIREGDGTGEFEFQFLNSIIVAVEKEKE